MKKLLHLILFAMLPSILWGQITFDKTYGYAQEREIPVNIYEDSNGDFLVHSNSFPKEDTLFPITQLKEYIYKIDQSGNLTDSLFLQDSISIYSSMFFIDDNFYFVGIQHDLDSIAFIVYRKYDTDFELISEIKYLVETTKKWLWNVRVKMTSDSNFVAVCSFAEEQVFEPLLFKLSLDGELLYSHIWTEENNAVKFYDITEQPDSSFLLFPSYINPTKYAFPSAIRLSKDMQIMDTVQTITSHVIEQLHSQRISDSTIVLVGTTWPNTSKPYLGVALYSNDFEEQVVHYYTHNSQQFEGRGHVNSISFNGEYVYVGGTSGQINFVIGQPSWYHLLKFTPELDTLWEKYYLVEAYGELRNVLATQDGGCLLLGYFYPASPFDDFNVDIRLIKVNADGIITWEKDIPLPKQNALVYPNPGKDQLNLKSTITNATFQLTNMHGKSLIKQDITQENTTFDTQQLPTGVYLWTLTQEGKVVERGKWVRD